MLNNIIEMLSLEEHANKIHDIEVVKKDNILQYHLSLKDTRTPCVSCGSSSVSIHSYYKRKLDHASNTICRSILIYKSRRYKCKHCCTVFFESNPFALKGEKFSLLTIELVLRDLRRLNNTFTSVGERYSLTAKSVSNIFDRYVDMPAGKPTEIMCFDETKINGDYAFIMVDFNTRDIIDVFPNRKKHKLSKIFSNYPKELRDNVKFVIIDMWDTYRDLSYIYFKNASIAVDSFHVIKNINKAVSDIRKREMNKYRQSNRSLHQNDMYYYMLKKFHYFFVKDFNNIYSGYIKIGKIRSKWDKHKILDYLLSINDELKVAYKLKEMYREFNLTAEYNAETFQQLSELIQSFLDNKSSEMRKVGRMLRNWQECIANSFIRVNNKRLSNSSIEANNSKIKTIIKNANGFTNFNRLRNKIMYSINKDPQILGVPKKIKSNKK